MAFENLKLLPPQQRPTPDAQARRRLRLMAQIDKQISFVTDLANSRKRRGKWFWQQPDGTLLLSIRYGRKELELAKGKTVVSCATSEMLLEALRECRAVTINGHFDNQLEKLSMEIRAGFKR